MRARTTMRRIQRENNYVEEERDVQTTQQVGGKHVIRWVHKDGRITNEVDIGKNCGDSEEEHPRQDTTDCPEYKTKGSRETPFKAELGLPWPLTDVMKTNKYEVLQFHIVRACANSESQGISVHIINRLSLGILDIYIRTWTVMKRKSKLPWRSVEHNSQYS